MQKVLVGFKGRRAAVNGQQVVDVAVQVLQLAQVDLVLLQIVGQRLVQRDQVLQVHTQDGHLEATALVINPPVVAVVTARGQKLCHLTQSLSRRQNEQENVNVLAATFTGFLRIVESLESHGISKSLFQTGNDGE